MLGLRSNKTGLAYVYTTVPNPLQRMITLLSNNLVVVGRFVFTKTAA